MELITITINKEVFESLQLEPSNYKVNRIEVKDDFFKDDEFHKQLKKDSDKLYKQLKEYEFKRRHNIQ